LLARIERLERLANVDAEGPPVPAPTVKKAGRTKASEAPERAPQASEPEAPAAAAAPEAEAPQAPDAGNVDVAMLRRSWPTLLDHLQTMRQPILKALLESATVASFDGTALELAFPPDKKFGVSKVIDRGDELREALGSLFGIRPELRCVVREAGADVVVVEEEEVPDEAEALRRVQEMLGAQVAGDAEE
jgi:DNA polymerase-3 subunit gamma/tau